MIFDQWIRRRDHQAIVDLLVTQLKDAAAERTALRESVEALTFATVQAARSGTTTERLVRKGQDAVKVAILEKAGGDLKLARYLSEWAMKERAKGEMGEDALITSVLNWEVVDDSSDDVMPL